MARHITAKKQLTRERALAIIDDRMDVHRRAKVILEAGGHPYAHFDVIMDELRQLRAKFEWSCDIGVFPPSK